MGIEWIRSCYEADFCFFRDRPDLKTRVRWYFTPPDAPVLPTPTIFHSAVWDVDDEPSPDLGEQLQPRPWRGGLPAYPPGPGSHYCGSAEQWLDGCDLASADPPTYPASTLPLCCPPPIMLSRGGIGLGVLASQSCELCGDGRPAVVIASYDGALNPCAFPLGTLVPLDRVDDPCFFDPLFLRPLYRSAAFDFAGTPVRLLILCQTGPAFAAEFAIVNADCSLAFGLAFTPDFFHCSPFAGRWTVPLGLGLACVGDTYWTVTQ